MRRTIFDPEHEQFRDTDSVLAQEEVFGPVFSILPAESDEHAIELANNSIYGLGGALWWAGRIRTGQIDVNAAPFNPRAPFGGTSSPASAVRPVTTEYMTFSRSRRCSCERRLWRRGQRGGASVAGTADGR